MQHNLAAGKAATLIKLAFAAGAKLSAAFIAFGLTALVTRNMLNDEAGLFGEGYEQAAIVLTIVLALVLTSFYGALAAAIVMAVGVAVQNIGAFIFVRVRLGFASL